MRRSVVIGIAIIIMLGIIGLASFLMLHNIDRASLLVFKQYCLYIKNQIIPIYYWHSVLIFCGLIAFATAFFIPVTVLFSIIAGFFYGPFWGAFYATVGVTVGSITFFIIARYLFRDWVAIHYGRRFQKVYHEIEQWGVIYIIIAHLLPWTPTAAISFLAGLSLMTVKGYVVGTLVGLFPPTIIYSAIGARTGILFESDFSQGDIYHYSVVIMALFIGLFIGLFIATRVGNLVWRRFRFVTR